MRRRSDRNRRSWAKRLSSFRRSDWTTEQSLARLLPACDLLVDATSMGLDPAREAHIPAPLELSQLAPGAVVSTLVYHRETALVAAARARGVVAIDGAGMLVHQGARAFRLWTGVDAPIEAMWTAMAQKRAGGHTPSRP